MSIVLLFMFPIGVLTYFWDRKNYKENLRFFNAYVEKIKSSNLAKEEQVLKLTQLFHLNNYEVVLKGKGSLSIEKKHFNLGSLFMLFGLMNVVGLAIYLLFYHYFLRPRTMIIVL